MSGAALSAHSLAQETKPGGRAKLYYFFIFFFLTRLLIGVILGFEVRSNQAVDLLAENVNSRTPTSTSRRRGAARTWRPSRAPTARGPDRLWLRSRRRTRGRALPPDRIQRGWSWWQSRRAAGVSGPRRPRNCRTTASSTRARLIAISVTAAVVLAWRELPWRELPWRVPRARACEWTR